MGVFWTLWTLLHQSEGFGICSFQQKWTRLVPRPPSTSPRTYTVGNGQQRPLIGAHRLSPRFLYGPLHRFASLWWSFGDGTKVVLGSGEVRRPTVIVFPPSKEQLQTSNATAVCVAKGGFPSTWTLSWKLGGTPSTSGVFHSPLGEAGGDGLYSWTSTLSLPADQWTKAQSVSCEAILAGQNPVTQTLPDPGRCSQ